ncbi:MAG: HAD family phosphatase [Pseudonocardia sp.]|uniref:HAD family hydrolase n=1 Tax=unclassified Pseudonocardia TaxID=2619320 RepID=UPI00086D20AD|nr:MULTISPECIES: HAD family phosphatase [unclassified Pseudonocardia]MBN9112575.1 HAD family phosphatase [Pseudonocardia sp.]ODV07042.1 MAG: HAD family hydrolase [Pseudonocardia sp. SCN 73-27]
MRADAPAAVLLDMDGTLVDSEKLWDRSLVDTLTWLGGGPLTDEARRETVGGNLAFSIGVLLREAGVEATAARVEETAEHLLARTEELFLLGLPWRPGAQELLASIHDAGIPTALVTNTGRRLTDLALRTIGTRWFAATVCGDEVTHGKPAPDVYLRATGLLGVPAQECLAVEDSPTGAAAADAAGAVVLVVPCEVPVPDGPRRARRDTLAGLDVAGLSALYAEVRERTSSPVR